MTRSAAWQPNSGPLKLMANARSTSASSDVVDRAVAADTGDIGEDVERSELGHGTVDDLVDLVAHAVVDVQG